MRGRDDAAASAGAIEQIGVEPIPVEQQTATAGAFFRIALGAVMTTTTIVLGTIPIALGLSFRAAAAAVVAGVVLGSLLVMPLALLGPRTRTNNAVSSGAQLGVTGRVVGSFLSLLIAISFFTVSVWVGGDALVAGVAHVAPGLGGDGASAAAYALVAAVIFVICIVGYRWLLAANTLIAPMIVVLLLLGLVAFGGRLDLSAPADPSGYALGGFWATWTAALLIVMANPVSYGPFLGDWSRYVPASTPARRLMGAVLAAQLLSILPFLFGAATATLVVDAGDYISGLVATAPGWYVAALVAVAVSGGIAGGVASLYGTGLDFSSVVPALDRVRATAAIGLVSIALVFVGRFAISMVDTVNAFMTLILVFSAPWAAVMLIGLFTRRGHVLVDDLQVFNRGERGGAYWFANGWNPRGVGAWATGSVAGLLLANTTLVAGPLHGVAGGVDVSFFAALLVGGAVYLALLFAFPEPSYVFGPRGPRLVPARDARPAPIVPVGGPGATAPEPLRQPA
ncbi:cytosine permease [Conexibacter arvalis]|uniref:Purine-cytosine permease-like protein n=1 Tax=Conexibacter arvalis TaxID=912552 RepID=A0A840IB18_9ACTN|nr:purine-cytosine permease-like protein [Conexibacter arvalis]